MILYQTLQIKKSKDLHLLEFIDKSVPVAMVNRYVLHDRTGFRLFAMMHTTDITIVPGTYFSALSIA